MSLSTTSSTYVFFFLPSILSVASNDKRDGRTLNLPFALALDFALALTFLLSEGKKGTPAVALTSGSRSLSHMSARRVIASKFSCLENRDIIQCNICGKRVVFLHIITVQSFFSDVASRVNRVVVCLISICWFDRVVVIVVIINGSVARVIGTCSRFSTAGVLAFAFLLEPTSVGIVNTFESVFAFPLRAFQTFLGGEYVDVG